jgi:hypothetical protein
VKLKHPVMENKLFPLLALVALGVGLTFAICAIVIYSAEGEPETIEPVKSQKSLELSTDHYALPHFIPTLPKSW